MGCGGIEAGPAKMWFQEGETMPTYQYIAVDVAQACDHCRAGFEITQHMADDALTHCPKCSRPIRRVIGPVGISTRKSTKSLLSSDNSNPVEWRCNHSSGICCTKL